MAPTRIKKRKSTQSATSVDMMQSFPEPPQRVPTKIRSPTKTPTSRSPVKKASKGITAAQKQALIDNLQLEITERARKLRAQYNLQAQGMRTRIEIRVNRIPRALRKANMGELFAKHSGPVPKAVVATSSRTLLNSPAKNMIQAGNVRASPSPMRPQKRSSDEMSTADKENEDIENPKKRSKQAPIPPARTASRKPGPSQVLSPRSANTRTVPRSPIRPTIVPQTKSALARPISPLKPAAALPSGGAAGILTQMVEKAKTRGGVAKKATESSTAMGRGKKAVAPVASAPTVGKGRASLVSESSESSNSTVVRKPVPIAKKEPVKRTVMGAIKGIGAKKGPPVPPKSTAPAGRVLRKRN